MTRTVVLGLATTDDFFRRPMLIIIYQLMFHSAHPEAIQHSRETRQSQKARQSDKRRGLKVVKEEEEKQQGHIYKLG
jgi:hypothetical protein